MNHCVSTLTSEDKKDNENDSWLHVYRTVVENAKLRNKKQNFSSPRWHQKCIIGVPNPSMSVVKGILKRVNYILTSSFSINKPYTVSTKHLVNGL